MLITGKHAACRCGGGDVSRVSSKQTNKNLDSNRNKPKQDLFRLCFGLFREIKNQNFGLFQCFEPISKQPKQTELFQNKPKQPYIFWKIPNLPSIKLFQLVFCLFQFNRNIETLCFGIEAKQLKQIISKQTKTNRKKP